MRDKLAPRVTIREIAQAAGTSVSTVSLALRDNSRISAATTARVRKEAARLGYQTDILGSLLRTANPRVLGLLCRLDQELHAVYYANIVHEARRLGYQLVTEYIGDHLDFTAAQQVVRGFRAGAIIAIDPGLPALSEDWLDDELAVIIGQPPDKSGADWVTSDNASGMAQVAEYLRVLGHKQITYLDGPVGLSASQRREAVQSAAAAVGIECRVAAAGADLDGGFQAVQRLVSGVSPLSLGALGTAVVCYNDHCAQGAILAILQAGLHIPQDISVIGVDNSRAAQSKALDLTSVDRQPERVGRSAVDLAVARLEGDDSAPYRLSVETLLVPRGSSGPARRLSGGI